MDNLIERIAFLEHQNDLLLQALRKGIKNLSAEERFWIRVRKTDSCWLWQGVTTTAGYGQLRAEERGKYHKAHRYAYELLVGPIPEGLDLHHTCENRLCVNPDHLQPIDPSEHALISDSPVGRNARKTHCNQGHEFTEENTYRPPSGGRQCRTCRNEEKRRNQAKRRQRQRALILAAA